MDLSCEYLGLRLPHPLMAGASPLSADLDSVRRLRDAGAAAITMHSLFEEQLDMERAALEAGLAGGPEALGAAVEAFPGLARFPLSSDAYFEQIRRIKEATGLPVIASLNGVTAEGWLEAGGLLEQAGADALELNCYRLVTEPSVTGEEVERETIEMVRALKKQVRVPVAIKLSPFYSSLPNVAARLVEAGADGLVLFNRFYQPEIDVIERQVVHWLTYSGSEELLLRLRWVALLSPWFPGSLAVSGGVHDEVGAVKAVMVGADAVQLVSALLEKGPDYLGVVLARLERWLEESGHSSLAELHDTMNLAGAPNPEIYERANYMEILQSRPVPGPGSPDRD